jgi:hypothetical protein
MALCRRSDRSLTGNHQERLAFEDALSLRKKCMKVPLLPNISNSLILNEDAKQTVINKLKFEDFVQSQTYIY